MQANEQTAMGRREFIGAAAAALFSGVVIQIVGCNSATGGDNGIPAGAKAGNVGAPLHGHIAYVTKAQLDAGGDATLSIQGTSGHTHAVDLTAADIAIIKTGSPQVIKQSSDGGSPLHSHTVTFN